jgi:hypothetical protein
MNRRGDSPKRLLPQEKTTFSYQKKEYDFKKKKYGAILKQQSLVSLATFFLGE